MKIPDEKACRGLMDRFGMLPNIVEHSYRVCQVALTIGRALNARGGALDEGLLMASSLLHDITKTRSLRTRENHAETGGELVAGLGYAEVGRIVNGHVHLTLEASSARIEEVHVVNYADKRVRHDVVVSFEERWNDLMERYGRTPRSRRRILGLKRIGEVLEERIFARLAFPPDALAAINDLDTFDLEGVPPTLRAHLEPGAAA